MLRDVFEDETIGQGFLEKFCLEYDGNSVSPFS